MNLTEVLVSLSKLSCRPLLSNSIPSTPCVCQALFTLRPGCSQTLPDRQVVLAEKYIRSTTVRQCPALWYNPSVQTIDRKGGHELSSSTRTLCVRLLNSASEVGLGPRIMVRS